MRTVNCDFIRTTRFEPGLARQLWPDAKHTDLSPSPFHDFLFRKVDGRFVRFRIINRGDGTAVFITDGQSPDQDTPNHQMNGAKEVVYDTHNHHIDFRKEGVTLRVFQTGDYAFWA